MPVAGALGARGAFHTEFTHSFTGVKIIGRQKMQHVLIYNSLLPPYVDLLVLICYEVLR